MRAIQLVVTLALVGLCLLGLACLSYASEAAPPELRSKFIQATATPCARYILYPAYSSVNVRRTPLVETTPGPVRTTRAGTAEPAYAIVRSSDGHDYYAVCNEPRGYVQDSVVRVTVLPTLKATETTRPTLTNSPRPSPTWTPVDTPHPLVVTSNGEPYDCNASIKLTDADLILMFPDGSWIPCHRIIVLPPTRIAP